MNQSAASTAFTAHPAAVPGKPQSVPSPVSSQPSASAGFEDLIRVFNTALVSTQAEPARDFAREIYDLMETPAFRSILSAVRQHARTHGMTEKQAAEQVIGAFRQMDRVWHDYVFQEGVNRLKTST